MPMAQLTSSAQVYYDGGAQRATWTLYKTGSASKHASADDQTLKQELIKALSLPPEKKEHQGQGVCRVRINGGKGYIVYRTGVSGPNTAAIFHYHWNYHLDLPLDAT